jgi:protein-disulfide isomerase
MNKITKSILIIQIQIILLLLIYALVKLVSLENKVYNTNAFIHQLITDSNLQTIQKVDQNDIVIGEENAPVSIIMYTKFNCVYCKEFFATTYNTIYNEYIVTGKVKFVIRYLINPDSEYFKLAQLSYSTYKTDRFEALNDTITLIELSDLTHQKIMEIVNSFGPTDTKNNDFIRKTNLEAKSAGIHRTPTFIIEGQKVVGNRNINKFKGILNSYIDSCD